MTHYAANNKSNLRGFNKQTYSSHTRYDSSNYLQNMPGKLFLDTYDLLFEHITFKRLGIGSSNT